MEEDIKFVTTSISLSVGDKIIGCLDTKYKVVHINNEVQIVTFTDEKTGIERMRSFSDISCEFKRIAKPYYDTEDIQVDRNVMANISLNEDDYIIVDQGNKAKVLHIDYLSEKVYISKYGDCSTLTFDGIVSGNIKKVVY